MAYCHKAKKIGFKKKAGALQQTVINSRNKHKTFGVYICQYCNQFHLTSQYDNRPSSLREKAESWWGQPNRKMRKKLEKKKQLQEFKESGLTQAELNERIREVAKRNAERSRPWWKKLLTP